MSGLNFSLGGKLDPSFKASLNEAVRESESASLRIQSSLRRQIGTLDKQLSAASPGSAAASAAAMQKSHLSNALLIAQNGFYLSAAKQRIAVKAEEEAAALAAEKAVGAAAEKTVGHIAGLNLVIRESIVLLREWGRGNYARMPGSASLVAQGLAQMGSTGKAIAFLNKPLFNNTAAQAEGAAAGAAASRGVIGALASIPLVAMAIVAGSLTAIIGVPFIYFHRVKKLAEELQVSIMSAFKPEHIAGYLSKLETLNQLHKDVADSVRQVQEAHDSVSDSIQRELDLTRDKISFERELLEMQKANALAAVKNPAEREAIEKKYSALITANKKKERDAEVQSMKEEAAGLPGEIAAKEAEIKRLTDGDYTTAGRDSEILRKRQADAGAYDDYRRQLMPGEKDDRKLSADKDRKIISDLLAKQKNAAAAGPYSFTDANKAELQAAQDRLNEADASQKALNEWIDTADGRERARQRVDELRKKVQADAERLAKLGPGAAGTIADAERKNLQKDKEDLRIEQERLTRVDAGRPLNGREVTERERVGFGSPQIALLDVNKSMDRKLGIIVQHVQHQGINRGGPMGIVVPAGFGD